MEWLKENVIAGLKGLSAGFCLILALWLGIEVGNAVAVKLLHLAVQFNLPENWAWLVNPFQGGVLAAFLAGVSNLVCHCHKKNGHNEK